MKNFLNSKIFTITIFFLMIMVIAKIVWLAISLLFLPNSGIEYQETSKMKALYYRVKLAKQSKAPVTTKVIKKAPTIGNMKGIKLLALYNSSDALVVTVEKANKTKVLAKGENIDGFKLSSAGADYAIFTKGEKEFKLILEGSKSKNSSTIKQVTPTSTKPKKEIKNGIVENEDGAGKIVSKGLLTSYTKDMDKIWKDIGIGDYKVNGKLQGFKVNFIKKGSDFEKLGLHRGDILKSVNGEELNSYSVGLSLIKEVDSIENLTLGIQRNNQDMELEYEIQ